MDIYNVENGETVFDQDGCVGTRLYEAAGCEYVHLAIAPGGGIPEHALPLAVSFYVLEGRGRCTVSGAECEVSAGEMVECPPNEPRGWRNESAETLQVLVIKRAANRAGHELR
ncbi:hypothetical protein PDESU_04218 [Pontiella desulfatans]|uniref:Cupin type-2 domain-containing protein n=1 Tax=Pontiella desulfatans TaxID=2750659 RepID=A0A6C2U6V4_PONDE|nr:cupin domain-containing protein [Pontiella desulfatans]VGO15633.1 hypothetical protein PDESU_04218 [Pontiella desulfatans]